MPGQQERSSGKEKVAGMTLQQLKYVSMVERCGSFSKAAQKLYVSQPSVSNLAHGLEEELHITIPSSQ